MKKLGLLVIMYLALGACELLSDGDLSAGQEQHGVQMVFEGVTARQYQKARLRFMFQASKLTLDEKAGVLRAHGGVQGRLEPDLWEGKEP